MYKTKTYANPLYRANTNEAVTYDFYNSQDQFAFGLNGFTACMPSFREHRMELYVQWYDNWFYSEDDLNLNAAVYRYIRVKVKNGSRLTNSRVYFITDGDGEYTEEKSVSFAMRPCDGLYSEYTLDMSENPRWKGRIRQVRFHPLDYSFDPGRAFGDMGVALSYEYIQFASEAVNPGAVSFQFKYHTEDFSPSAGAELSAEEYMLVFRAPEGGAYIQSPPGLLIDTGVNRYLRVRQKTAGGNGAGALYYTTDGDREFDEQKKLEYAVPFDADEFVQYSIDLSSIDGCLYQIRLAPLGGGSGVCEIDHIVFDTLEVKDVRLPAGRVLMGGDPNACYEAKGIAADAVLLKYVKIRMVNRTWSRNAILQWTTEDSPVYNEKQSQPFIIRAMSDEAEYTVGLNQNQSWRGRITGLRILPARDVPEGDVEIVSAGIFHDGDAMSQNRDIREGFLELGNDQFISGWRFDRSGGDILGYVGVDCGWVTGGNLEGDPGKRAGSFTLVGEGNGKTTAIEKSVPRQTDGITDWSFAFQTDNPAADGVTVRLTGGGADTVVFYTESGSLCTAGRALTALEPLRWTEIRALLDFDQRLYMVELDGRRLEGAFPLPNPLLDGIRFELPSLTPVRLTGSTRLYKLGYAFEDYFILPDMDLTESVRIAGKRLFVEHAKGREPVDYTLRFVRDAYGLVDYETVFLIHGRDTEAAFELMAGEKPVTGLYVENGGLYCRGGGERRLVWEAFKPNVWYTMVVTVNTVLKTAAFRINGQIRAKDVPLDAMPDGLGACRISAAREAAASLEVRRTRVKPYYRSTVPPIDKAPSRSGLVGMQAWFLLAGFWMRTDKQFGVSDKTPYLGRYDDINLEAAEWQIKFMAEHGVDFFSPFMYTGLSAPAYSEQNLLTTFLHYSEQHDKMKFCITIGEIFETMTHGKMMDNVLPYLIEAYFKHPSYLKVDNKPVLMLYSWETMASHMSAGALRALFEDMRRALKDEGFDGLIILGEERPNLDGSLARALELHRQCGLDYTYAYCNIYTQTAAAGYVENAAKAGMKAVKSFGCGWDNRYWAPPGGYFIINSTPAEFEAGMRWMAEAPQNGDPLSGMVLLDNWSEFGEGHSISPSNLYGFGYLNAIRKVFSERDELHYDTVPEGAYNALNLHKSELDYREPDVIFYSRWPMPPDYENSRYSGRRG